MLRTIDKIIVRRVEYHLHKLWESGEKFDDWYQRQKTKLPEELLTQVGIDYEAVLNVSKSTI